MSDDVQVVVIEAEPTVTPVYVPGSGGSTGIDPVTVQVMINDSVAEHVQAAQPHPYYDDLPSLTLLFENGLV